MQDIAIQRAHAPWIGCGTQGKWYSVEDALEACGLYFEVESLEAQVSYDEDGRTYFSRVPGVRANVRSDSHEILGCVSSTYRLVQNREAFSCLEPFLDNNGTITCGGMTSTGLCFMIVRMEVRDAGGDDYEINLMATNSFNAKFPTSLIWAPVRIVCQNMYRSLCNSRDNVAKYRHSMNVQGKLSSLKEAYDATLSFEDKFSRDVRMLKSRKSKHSAEELAELMFPYTVTDSSSPRYESSRDRVDENRAYFVNRYYNSPTNSDHGTCFSLVNAYYDYVSHHVSARKTEDTYRDARLSGIVAGTFVKPKIMQFMCE